MIKEIDKDTTGLIGQPAVARFLGVTVRSVGRHRSNPDLDFPIPLDINGRKYFDAEEIRVWAQNRRALLFANEASVPAKLLSEPTNRHVRSGDQAKSSSNSLARVPRSDFPDLCRSDGKGKATKASRPAAIPKGRVPEA